jgi:RND family efflux transporter MFP subunit
MPLTNRFCVAVLALLAATHVQAAPPVEGFLEPYKTIDVAASESGIIDALEVIEGQSVKKGQALAQLDQDVHKAAVEIARRSAEARGQLNGAQSELNLVSSRLKKLQLLRQKDHATPEEISRAELDVATAEARVLIAKETLEIRSAEFERYRIQLERRTVRSPIDGIVIVLHRDVGEFVSPNEPVVASVVQLDPLIATFSIPIGAVAELELLKSLSLKVSSTGQSIEGQVDYIAPVMNPQTGTVTVKVRVPNPKGKLRSGEKCLFSGMTPPTPIPTPRGEAANPKSAATPRPTVTTKPVSDQSEKPVAPTLSAPATTVPPATAAPAKAALTAPALVAPGLKATLPTAPVRPE